MGIFSFVKTKLEEAKERNLPENRIKRANEELQKERIIGKAIKAESDVRKQRAENKRFAESYRPKIPNLGAIPNFDAGISKPKVKTKMKDFEPPSFF